MSFIMGEDNYPVRGDICEEVNYCFNRFILNPNSVFTNYFPVHL